MKIRKSFIKHPKWCYDGYDCREHELMMCWSLLRGYVHSHKYCNGCEYQGRSGGLLHEFAIIQNQDSWRGYLSIAEYRAKITMQKIRAITGIKEAGR